MSHYLDGLPVADNLFEAAAWHKAIKVTCRCGHFATFDPHGLWWHFECKGWDMRLREARWHFACKVCRDVLRQRVRPDRLEPISGPGSIRLPWPPEREWKRAQSRFR
ncbi:MAG: hypothetical protein EOP17_00630 [Rhizobiaceae bacterium]|nr:MAG: hypothetical protein EOP17_00630 [Rhizobiaceae bacterium]